MRVLVLIASLFLITVAGDAFAQPAGQNKKESARPRPNYDPPKAQRPEVATLTQIAEKTDELRAALASLRTRNLPDPVMIDVEIYLKAAENIVRFDEWYTAESGKWALTTLDQGLARAKQAEGGTPVWANTPGQWVLRAYRSAVDGSIQPFAVLLPADYDPSRQWRLDVVLHGRDSSLTEAKFIATHIGNAPEGLGQIQLEVYGRGNNAYRWAGEADVFEAVHWFRFGPPGLEGRPRGPVDPNRIVLRGFSMGGAGTWHIGLHHPGNFCVIGPGAGFTTTHGYVADLPEKLPDYVEKCLHIYDAVDYAENAFNVPVVAYSGENDAQRMAATNIENTLKDFKESLRFTHLIAPGLEHAMPKEWQDKAEVEYRKFADPGRTPPERVRFVTYTPKYGRCDWAQIDSLETTFEKAIVDGTRKGNHFDVATDNVRRITMWLGPQGEPLVVKLDGQTLDTASVRTEFSILVQAERVDGKWTLIEDPRDIRKRLRDRPEKHTGLQGPIDDAFTSAFVVIQPTEAGFHRAHDSFLNATAKQFAGIWDKYFRGTLPVVPASAPREELRAKNLVLFGDPASNPLIADILPQLPITWTKDRLMMNGVEYDAKSHIPVLIYPNPKNRRQYVVLNSGHTFRESDLKGTNALLYPRLGDWAVIKPTPTAANPTAYEVVAAGLFDEDWKFVPSK